MSACVCVCEHHLVNLRGALSEHGADGGGEAQLHQALQVSLGVRLRLVSGLLQRAAVNQGETPAAAVKGKGKKKCQAQQSRIERRRETTALTLTDLSRNWRTKSSN